MSTETGYIISKSRGQRSRSRPCVPSRLIAQNLSFIMSTTHSHSPLVMMSRRRTNLYVAVYVSKRNYWRSLHTGYFFQNFEHGCKPTIGGPLPFHPSLSSSLPFFLLSFPPLFPSPWYLSTLPIPCLRNRPLKSS